MDLSDSDYVSVEPGHRGIIFNRFGGIENKVRAEGAHFRVPVLQVRTVHIQNSRQPSPILTLPLYRNQF